MHALTWAGRVVGGRYRLQDPIGHGAMGTVWRARDELLDRDVAVKEVMIRPALSDAERSSAYERTLREAKTAARLNHPGVVAVFDVVEEDGRPWIVMELVQARSLEQVLAEDGPLPPARAADIGQQLVSALATAHCAGVLHRDVKPSNVLLAPDGRAVLTDFGIATFEGDAQLTQTGMVMGTPAFTSPERIRGEPATPSSDLWSLGATLYAAVQGRGPYQERGGALTTMNAVLHEDVPVASSAGQLGPVIAALMCRDPAARPDAARAALLLSGALGGGPWAGDWPGGCLEPTGTARPGGGVPGGGWSGDGATGGRWPGENWLGSLPAGAGEFPVSAAFSGAAPPQQPPAFGVPASCDMPSPTAWGQQLGPSGGSWPMGEATTSYPSAAGESASPYATPGGTMYSAPVSEAPPYLPPLGAGQAGHGTSGPSHASTVRSSRHGGRAALAACATVAIVAAGVIGGFAVAHATRSSPTAGGQVRRDTSHATSSAANTSSPGNAPATATARPAGYDWYSLPAASAGTAAGFRLAVPRGWDASRKGLVTYLRAPAGAGFMEVDLTPHTFPGPMTEARWLEARTRRQGKFPGYRPISIRPVEVLGSTGAVWSFSWLEAGVGRVVAEDYLLDLSTSGGSQSYAVYASAPIASWPPTAQILSEAIRTFQPLT
jgi:tRNA A-37 threonylcarbamoyl transferase component Bud32